MSRKSSNTNEGVLGCLVWAILAVVAMPILGIYLMGKGSDGEKVLGFLLFLVGLILVVCMLSY